MPLSGRSVSVVSCCSSGTPNAKGLAHAGAGLADQIVAGQGQRQGQFLDREGVFDAGLGEGAHDLVANSELGK